MGYAVAGWCHASLAEAAAAMLVARSTTGGAFVVQGVAVSGSDLALTGELLEGTAANAHTVTVAVPTCTDLGPLHNSSGLSLADAVTLSWLVVAVWVSAAAIKWLGRGLMQ